MCSLLILISILNIYIRIYIWDYVAVVMGNLEYENKNKDRDVLYMSNKGKTISL